MPVSWRDKRFPEPPTGVRLLRRSLVLRDSCGSICIAIAYLGLYPAVGERDILSRFVLIPAVCAAVLVTIVALAVFGYTGVDVGQSGDSLLVVEINRDWRSSQGPLIRGVTAETTIDVRSSTFTPLYVPAMEHQLLIGGEPVGSPLQTPVMWLRPWGNQSLPVSVFIPREDLPGLIVWYLVSGGDLDITVESAGTVAGRSVTWTQTVPFTVSNPSLSFRGS